MSSTNPVNQEQTRIVCLQRESHVDYICGFCSSILHQAASILLETDKLAMVETDASQPKCVIASENDETSKPMTRARAYAEEKKAKEAEEKLNEIKARTKRGVGRGKGKGKGKEKATAGKDGKQDQADDVEETPKGSSSKGKAVDTTTVLPDFIDIDGNNTQALDFASRWKSLSEDEKIAVEVLSTMLRYANATPSRGVKRSREVEEKQESDTKPTKRRRSTKRRTRKN
ncbi:hypothetical protein AX16_006113 [Volvariella volvacea WC 439]|nr:hypothetical protein AX16_006113 [Volvariella volvacea WC 439]